MKNNFFYQLQLLRLQTNELLEKSKARQIALDTINERLKAILLTSYTLVYQSKNNFEIEREIKNIATSEMSLEEKQIRLTAIENIISLR